MNTELLKKVYGVVLVVTGILFVVSLVLKNSSSFGGVSKIAVFVLAIVLLVNLLKYKQIYSENTLSSASMVLMATTIIATVLFIGAMGFVAGRIFIAQYLN